jgi:beta-galactosidase
MRTKGFFLNGRNVKIKGVCCHQDYGLTGKAMPDRVHRYRLKRLKEMGANGYRAAHYPPAEATMDALDELGFLVMDETRWFESTKDGLAQLEMMLKRDRNRPSVILWSVGNEEPLHLTEQGKRILQSMTAFVKKFDTSRPVTTAISHNPSGSESNRSIGSYRR